MKKKRKILNLKGVISPLDLLKCKSILNSMQEGDLLEVILADQEIADKLITIINRSEDELSYQKKKQGNICLGIIKRKKVFTRQQSKKEKS